MSNSISRRSGGRTARKTARAAPLAEHLRPVKAGMVGGSYSPLSPQGEKKIHNAALEALEFIGLADAPQSGIDSMLDAGAVLDDNGRLISICQEIEFILVQLEPLFISLTS